MPPRVTRTRLTEPRETPASNKSRIDATLRLAPADHPPLTRSHQAVSGRGRGRCRRGDVDHRWADLLCQRREALGAGMCHHGLHQHEGEREDA